MNEIKTTRFSTKPTYNPIMGEGMVRGNLTE
jgi:hypothetical protein